jgi:hypothetical protein
VILRRLRLTNFRGVGNREIAFPDQGVVVVILCDRGDRYLSSNLFATPEASK